MAPGQVLCQLPFQQCSTFISHTGIDNGLVKGRNCWHKLIPAYGIKSRWTGHKAHIGVILGFCRDVDEICALLGYYAVSCGNCLPMFRENLSVSLSWLHSKRCLYPPLPFPCSTLLAVTTLTDYHPARTFAYRMYATAPVFFSPRTLDPWRWARYVIPKRRYTITTRRA
jgi:hypothetical protein